MSRSSIRRCQISMHWTSKQYTRTYTTNIYTYKWIGAEFTNICITDFFSSITTFIFLFSPVVAYLCALLHLYNWHRTQTKLWQAAMRAIDGTIRNAHSNAVHPHTAWSGWYPCRISASQLREHINILIFLLDPQIPLIHLILYEVWICVCCVDAPFVRYIRVIFVHWLWLWNLM